MYQCDPALPFASLLLKFGPWKDMLLHQWHQMSSWPNPESQVQTSMVQQGQGVDYQGALQKAQARSKALQKLLASTAKGINNQPVKAEWAVNANRHGSHYSGPAAQLQLSQPIFLP